MEGVAEGDNTIGWVGLVNLQDKNPGFSPDHENSPNQSTTQNGKTFIISK